MKGPTIDWYVAYMKEGGCYMTFEQYSEKWRKERAEKKAKKEAELKLKGYVLPSPERVKNIITMRREEKRTLKYIADKLGITPERVRQIIMRYEIEESRKKRLEQQQLR